MAKPTTRATLQDYCLRNLGAPVIEINVDEDQLEDRTDEALQFYQEYHHDAIEKVYLKHKVTGSTLTLSAAVAGNFTVGETITGGTSDSAVVNHTDPHQAPDAPMLIAAAICLPVAIPPAAKIGTSPYG